MEKRSRKLLQRFRLPNPGAIVHLLVVEALVNVGWWMVTRWFVSDDFVHDLGFLVLSVAALFAVAWYLTSKKRKDVIPVHQKGNEFVKDAWIRFHLYGDERTPERLEIENVWRWYYLRLIAIGVDKKAGVKEQLLQTVFFLTFDRPVKIGTLEISSPDFKLPRYEVKDFSSRSAIVVFSGPLPTGTLEMRVRQ